MKPFKFFDENIRLSVNDDFSTHDNSEKYDMLSARSMLSQNNFFN